MSVAASKIAGLHAMKQRWNVADNSTPNMRDLLPVNYHFLLMHQDFAPSPKGSEPSGGMLVSRSLVLTPMTKKANPAQWLTLYEIAVKAVGRDEDIMANYLLIMLNQSANNWLLSLWENSI